MFVTNDQEVRGRRSSATPNLGYNSNNSNSNSNPMNRSKNQVIRRPIVSRHATPKHGTVKGKRVSVSRTFLSKKEGITLDPQLKDRVRKQNRSGINKINTNVNNNNNNNNNTNNSNSSSSNDLNINTSSSGNGNKSMHKPYNSDEQTQISTHLNTEDDEKQSKLKMKAQTPNTFQYAANSHGYGKKYENIGRMNLNMKTLRLEDSYTTETPIIGPLKGTATNHKAMNSNSHNMHNNHHKESWRQQQNTHRNLSSITDLNFQELDALLDA